MPKTPFALQARLNRWSDAMAAFWNPTGVGSARLAVCSLPVRENVLTLLRE